MTSLATKHKQPQKTENLFAEFFFGHRKTLPKAPWSVADALKALIFASVGVFCIMYALKWGAIKIWGEETAIVWLVEHLTIVLIIGMLMQIFIELAFLFWYTKRKYNTTAADFGFRLTPVSQTLSLAIILFTLMIIGEFFFNWGIHTLGIPQVGSQSLVPDLLYSGVMPYWFFFIFAGIIAPFVEELIFRGVLLGAIVPKVGYMWGVVLSAAIFSVSHLEWTALLPLFLFGAVMAVLYIRTRSLWPGVIFHGINNVVAVFIIMKNKPATDLGLEDVIALFPLGGLFS